MVERQRKKGEREQNVSARPCGVHHLLQLLLFEPLFPGGLKAAIGVWGWVWWSKAVHGSKAVVVVQSDHG